MKDMDHNEEMQRFLMERHEYKNADRILILYSDDGEKTGRLMVTQINSFGVGADMVNIRNYMELTSTERVKKLKDMAGEYGAVYVVPTKGLLEFEGKTSDLSQVIDSIDGSRLVPIIHSQESADIVGDNISLRKGVGLFTTKAVGAYAQSKDIQCIGMDRFAQVIELFKDRAHRS